MTQGQLAEAIGCRVKDISRWENGHVEPGVLTVKKIAQVLGCSMDELQKNPAAALFGLPRGESFPALQSTANLPVESILVHS